MHNENMACLFYRIKYCFFIKWNQCPNVNYFNAKAVISKSFSNFEGQVSCISISNNA